MLEVAHDDRASHGGECVNLRGVGRCADECANRLAAHDQAAADLAAQSTGGTCNEHHLRPPLDQADPSSAAKRGARVPNLCRVRANRKLVPFLPPTEVAMTLPVAFASDHSDPLEARGTSTHRDTTAQVLTYLPCGSVLH